MNLHGNAVAVRYDLEVPDETLANKREPKAVILFAEGSNGPVANGITDVPPIQADLRHHQAEAPRASYRENS